MQKSQYAPYEYILVGYYVSPHKVEVIWEKMLLYIRFLLYYLVRLYCSDPLVVTPSNMHLSDKTAAAGNVRSGCVNLSEGQIELRRLFR